MMKRAILVGFLCLQLAGSVQADGGVAPKGKDAESDIRSFEECVRRAGTILKSYPPQCVTSDGRVFVETSGTAKKACKDQCGDGFCQEIVCMAIGCPCAETPQSCPDDCAKR